MPALASAYNLTHSLEYLFSCSHSSEVVWYYNCVSSTVVSVCFLGFVHSLEGKIVRKSLGLTVKLRCCYNLCCTCILVEGGEQRPREL